MDAEKAQLPVAVLCQAVEVSRAGFYAWRGRPESERAREDRRLAVLVRAAHETGRRTYGSPRVLRELRAQEIRIDRKRIMRLMRAKGLEPRVRWRYRCTTMSEDEPIAPNLLGRLRGTRAGLATSSSLSPAVASSTWRRCSTTTRALSSAAVATARLDPMTCFEPNSRWLAHHRWHPREGG